MEVIKEEVVWNSLRLCFTQFNKDGVLCRIEMSVHNLETTLEEEMRCYGYICFEHHTYIISLQDNVDVVNLLGHFSNYLNEKLVAGLTLDE